MARTSCVPGMSILEVRTSLRLVSDACRSGSIRPTTIVTRCGKSAGEFCTEFLIGKHRKRLMYTERKKGTCALTGYRI